MSTASRQHERIKHTRLRFSSFTEMPIPEDVQRYVCMLLPGAAKPIRGSSKPTRNARTSSKQTEITARPHSLLAETRTVNKQRNLFSIRVQVFYASANAGYGTSRPRLRFRSFGGNDAFSMPCSFGPGLSHSPFYGKIHGHDLILIGHKIDSLPCLSLYFCIPPDSERSERYEMWGKAPGVSLRLGAGSKSQQLHDIAVAISRWSRCESESLRI